VGTFVAMAEAEGSWCAAGCGHRWQRGGRSKAPVRDVGAEPSSHEPDGRRVSRERARTRLWRWRGCFRLAGLRCGRACMFGGGWFIACLEWTSRSRSRSRLEHGTLAKEPAPVAAVLESAVPPEAGGTLPATGVPECVLKRRHRPCRKVERAGLNEGLGAFRVKAWSRRRGVPDAAWKLSPAGREWGSPPRERRS